MKDIIQIVERIIARLLAALFVPARMAIKAGRTLAKPVISLIVFVLFLVCMDLINSIYPITGLKAIIITVIVIGIRMSWPKKYNGLGKLVLTVLVFANILLAITTFLPGLKSTLISMWWHQDNSTFADYEQGEELEKNIQEAFKRKEALITKESDKLLEKFEIDSAITVLTNLTKAGENYKDKLYTIDSLKKRNRDMFKDQPKVQQVVYQPPIPPQWSVEKIGDNKVRVHFVPNCTIPTGLEFKSGDTYRFLNPSAPFDVAGSRKPLYTITGNIDFEAKKAERFMSMAVDTMVW